MIGLLKNGQKVEVKKIIPDWNRVETNDNQICALWELEVIYSSYRLLGWLSTIAV